MARKIEERKMYALTQKYLESTLNLCTAGWAALILLFQLVTAIPTTVRMPTWQKYVSCIFSL